jgi:hypothetical protein
MAAVNLTPRTISRVRTADLQDWAGYSFQVSERVYNDSLALTKNHSTLAIDDDLEMMVSRNHCEIYVVVYEPTINHIYVRDRKSSNGTLVNGKAIGSGPDISPGYLLQHGDMIEIRPY